MTVADILLIGDADTRFHPAPPRSRHSVSTAVAKRVASSAVRSWFWLAVAWSATLSVDELPATNPVHETHTKYACHA